MLIAFFFQAEDGIRDWSVTGVQTCALPIFEQPLDVRQMEARRRLVEGVDGVLRSLQRGQLGRDLDRSEERRVGKDKGHRMEMKTAISCTILRHTKILLAVGERIISLATLRS